MNFDHTDDVIDRCTHRHTDIFIDRQTDRQTDRMQESLSYCERMKILNMLIQNDDSPNKIPDLSLSSHKYTLANLSSRGISSTGRELHPLGREIAGISPSPKGCP